MSIKDGATYGQHYWLMQVEAAKLLAEDTESELSNMAANLMGNLRTREILPPELASLFAEIEAPAGAFLGDVGGRFVSEVADGAVSQAASPFFESMGYAAYKLSPTKKMTPQASAVLFSRKKISPEFFDERFRMGGFEPIEARFQYDSMRAYPSIPDIITYSRYHGDPKNVWSTSQKFFDIDAVDFKVWEWLGLQRLTTIQAHALLRRGIYVDSDYMEEMAKMGWSFEDTNLLKNADWTVPNAMLLVQGNLMQQKGNERILADISHADIHPEYAELYLDAILTKPSSADLVAYELRQDPNLTGLDAQLQRIGIHPAYTDVYKTLAYQIPPVADIITMAVREAFTPAIAARFGQYEDFPPEFAQWAAKKGLTKDWSERYWAAHWSLPSAQQGFEMLHRGIVNENDLDMLLRALDIMPFWREKLTKMAYKRLTRVDIRRMYGVGVLDEAAVYEAYLELGYNERDAQRMSEFTVKQTLATQSKFTSRDVVSAYTNYLIDRSDARVLLIEVGVKQENVEFVIKSAEYKRQWEFTESRISAIRNLYKKKVYTKAQAEAELGKLDLPADRTQVLMQQWYYEIKEEVPRPFTTAQTLGFIKAELIKKDRGIIELEQMGYDTEHINVFLKSIE